MENKYYVYEWYNVDTNEVFYVGKGCGKRAYDIKHRNHKFNEYYNTHNTNVRILFSELSENEAFQKEKEVYNDYLEKGYTLCNLMECGQGGLGQIWTDEMRKYWSEHNPMKEPEQIERMIKENPMKNKEIALKSGQKHKRAVIINGVYYDGLSDAAKIYNITPEGIAYWCKKGKNSKGEICEYADKKETKSKTRSKPVIIDGKLYESIAQGARAINENKSCLARYLQLGKKEFKGHTCEYANQQPSQ